MLITGKIFGDMIISAANNLNNQKDMVDSLNVFPVPDGDTGANMYMTMTAASNAIQGKSKAEVGDAAELTASALLRGARGNSGVILSLLFRGFAKCLKNKASADGKDLADALQAGVKAAYKAVMKPTEGTILTVARVSAEKGVEFAAQNDDPLSVLKYVIEVAEETLLQTPEMLPVLKQAGVVDAGGKGYIVVLNGMLSVLENNEIIQAIGGTAKMNEKANFESFSEEDITLTYCTEFIINKREKLTDGEIIGLQAYIMSIGDSVVFVDDGEVIKVHVHTDNPGTVIERALMLGSLTAIKIENMRLQHSRLATPKQSEEEKPLIAPPEKKYGFVAVAAGEGIEAVFKDFAVDNVVTGGQTMNPSTEDILLAINATPAEIVFVLPNNKNIIMAAEMAQTLTEKTVCVLPTKTLPQGITALMNFNPDAEVGVNFETMKNAISTVITGQVTHAVRDSNIDDRDIKEGQYLGLLDNKINNVSDTLELVIDELFDAMIAKTTPSFVSIYYGEEVTDEMANQTAIRLKEKLDKSVEVGILFGGQPVYPYIFAIE